MPATSRRPDLHYSLPRRPQWRPHPSWMRTELKRTICRLSATRAADVSAPRSTEAATWPPACWPESRPLSSTLKAGSFMDIWGPEAYLCGFCRAEYMINAAGAGSLRIETAVVDANTGGGFSSEPILLPSAMARAKRMLSTILSDKSSMGPHRLALDCSPEPHGPTFLSGPAFSRGWLDCVKALGCQSDECECPAPRLWPNPLFKPHINGITSAKLS
jgi:hypothetical protein